MNRDQKLSEGAAGWCSTQCEGCWKEKHTGHDIAMRHEDGRLYSGTCFDCNEWYHRAPAGSGRSA